MSPLLEVRTSGHHGRGIFANARIAARTRLAVFGGSILSNDDALELPPSLQPFAMQIEERFVLAAPHSLDRDDTRFFNHSCNPNAGIRGQLFLVAMRAIEADEEVTFDYAMTVANAVGGGPPFDMPCNCGARSCRGRITENDWRIPTLQRAYRGFFSTYIEDLIEAAK
jgi:hypothetical protein